MPARRERCAKAAPACSRWGSPTWSARSTPATPSRSSTATASIGKGICNYSAPELRRVKGLKSAEVRQVIPRATEEAVHRDYFVLS